MSRYVIAPMWDVPDGTYPLLPDAEHVHVTRHPDGTYTAVPMRRAAVGRDVLSDCRHEHVCEQLTGPVYVDAPVEDQS